VTRIEADFARSVSPEFLLDVVFALDLPEEAPVAALFGPSGCGKSTTLAVLAGLLAPDRGGVRIGGEPLDGPPDRRGVGLVAQDGLLFPHLTVAGNLDYADRRRRGRPAPSRGDVVETLRLGALLERRPLSLSGGERQRVALARALCAGPRLLLLDEPVSALDAAARREALDFVAATIRRFRVPTLFVSHQQEEVLRVASRVVRMEAGRVAAAGGAAEVLGGLPLAGGVGNLLRAVYSGPGRGDRAVGPGDAALRLPREGEPGEAVWCRLASGAIALEPPDAAGATSARNRLPGRVAKVWREGHGVRVAVEAGALLQVDVSEEAARELALAEGRTVRCVFKVHALEVLA
jgi:molybdate transport system ATP-binding protein